MPFFTVVINVQRRIALVVSGILSAQLHPTIVIKVIKHSSM